MPTLYWKNVSEDFAFENPINWFTDAAATTAAASAPWLEDNIYKTYDLTRATEELGSPALDVYYINLNIGYDFTITGTADFANLANNSANIYSGTFSGTGFYNYGYIYGGTFSGDSFYNYGYIYGGTFSGNYFSNYFGTINNGTFGGEGFYNNGGNVYGGTFGGDGFNNSGYISGGNFLGNEFVNNGSIDGGSFTGSGYVNNYGIYGGTFNGDNFTNNYQIYNFYGTIFLGEGIGFLNNADIDSVTLTITGVSESPSDMLGSFYSCTLKAYSVNFTNNLNYCTVFANDFSVTNCEGSSFTGFNMTINGTMTDCNVRVNGVTFDSSSSISGGYYDIFNEIYYKPAVDSSWDTVGNWFTDPECTAAAGRLPSLGESVYLAGEVTSIAEIEHSQIARVVAGHPSTGGGIFRVQIDPLYVNNPSNEYLFYGSTKNHSDLPKAKFLQSSINSDIYDASDLITLYATSIDTVGIAGSSDLNYAFIARNNGVPLRTANAGSSWSFISGIANQSSVCSSSSGEYVYITTGGSAGQILKSSDYGQSFSALTSAGTKLWSTIICSSDGTRVYAYDGAAYPGNISGNIYTSSDSGTSWSSLTAADTRIWTAMCCSSNGQIVYAVTRGTAFKSTDSGTTWTQLTIDEDIFTAICCSSTGDIAYIASGSYGSGKIYKTSNGGTTWTSTGILSVERDYQQIRCSSDGVKMVVTYYSSGFLYTSDGGSTWSFTKSDGPRYYSVAMSSDGSKVLTAGAYPAANIYLYDSSGVIFPEGVVDKATFADNSQNLGTITTFSILGNNNPVGTITSGDYARVIVDNTGIVATINSSSSSHSDTLNFKQLDVIGSGLI